VHDAGGDGTKSSGVARHGWIGHERAKSRFHRLHPRGWIADDGIREVKVAASNATNDPPQNVRRIEQHRLTYRAQGECLEAGRFGDKKLATPAVVCCRVEKPQERRPIRKDVNRADRDKFACSSLVWPDWFGAAGRSQVRTLEARQAQLRIVTIWLTLQRDTKGMCPGRQSEVRSGLSQ
jgi:hypothetical protein